MRRKIVTRVPYDSLEYSDDGDYCLDGRLFTGVAFSLDEDGWLEKEIEYRNGAEWGMKRYWYAPDKLLEEAQMRAGVVHGKERRWYRTGNLEEEADCEFGIVLRRRTWDENGILLEEYELKETDGDFASLQKLREIYKDDLERERLEDQGH
jgi:antitoxin component YwqK of YwqJK toxin-antitoxin module